MKPLLLFIFALALQEQAFAQFTDDFKLPKTWTKDFTISLHYGGSMDGSKHEIIFTYDSCTYVGNVGMKAPTRRALVLKESDRIEILRKLHEWKIDGVESNTNMVPSNDGWSTSLCMGYNCIDGGSSANMSDSDKGVFHDAYNYLQELAMKGKPMKNRR